MTNLNELSNNTQVCLVPNPNSMSSVFFERKLLNHSEWTVCECVAEHRGYNGDYTTREENRLRIASEQKVSECGEL